MSLKTRYIALMLLLTMLFSNVIYGDETLKPSYSDRGEVIPGIYMPDTVNKQNPNLLIGGIRQNSADPDENADYKEIAKQLGAIYIPTYYSGPQKDDTDNIKKTISDALEVRKAASTSLYGRSMKSYSATYMNGLKNIELNDRTYNTIVAYSGGTTSAVTALYHQGVKCHSLILVSPMVGKENSQYLYKEQIKALLDSGAVKHIVIIQSSSDELPIGNLYQARFKTGEIAGVDVYDVNLDTTGIDAHKDLFFNYAKTHLKKGSNDRIYYQEQPASQSDIESPSIIQKTQKEPTQTKFGDTSQNQQLDIPESTGYIEQNADHSSSSKDSFDANSEGKSLAAEAFAEKYQSTEPSSDIAQGLEPITQAIATSAGESTAKSFKKGDRIETTDLLNVRSEPGLPADSSLDTKISAPKSKGSTGTILNDQPVFEDGFTWWEIQYDDGTIGWSQDKRLELDTRDASFGTTLGATSSSGDLPQQRFGSNSESELGGVNFTSIKLNYISMTTDETGGVNFDLILKAEKAEGTKPGIDIQKATRLGATAFLTGLAVPDSKFWVNLAPWEADRIIDDELDESEVGKIMLEADLQMKRDFSNYYNPCANETGKALRSLLEKKSEFLVQRCMNNFPGQIKDASNVFFKPIQRHWIVPDKVYAYSNGSLIYIINASLTINSEPVIDHASFRVENQDISTLSKNCIEELNRSAQEYAEYLNDLEERMIQPYVIADINIGERYEDLREVYAALALAQWYKSKATPNTDIFKDNLDSSSSAILKSQTLWHPKDIWDKYVYSFNNGEYKCWENTTTKTAKGTRTKSLLCSSGGVEFEGIKNHFVKIEAIPPEVQSQANMAITDGIVYGRKEVLFGYRLHADQERENQITGSSLGSSIRSPDLNKRINSPLKENRNVNETDLTSKNIQIQSNETPSAQKASGNLSNVTCPDGWIGPDENGKCWQMQIMS